METSQISLTRRRFLKVITASGSCMAMVPYVFARSKTGVTKPNFVFLFADDLGWGDLGCYGHRRLKTPHLDKLAKEGTLFTQFYVSGSVCSPSRAAIMTGHFPARHCIHGHFAGHENNKRRSMPNFLNPNVTTVTSLFQQNGYVTGHFGKWHLGHGSEAPEPGAYGIDKYRTTSSNDPQAGEDFNLWRCDLRPVATKAIVDETIKFIEKNKDKPFYVNAWFIDPHTTLNPSEEQMKLYQRYAPRGVRHKGASQIYYATVTEMDKQIGIFLKRLKELGLAENTIVIFSSDNGPEDFALRGASHSGVGSAGPFRGRKRSLYEGGIRVPFIVRWPQTTPAGKVDNSTVIGGVDYLPTICALAGIKLSADLKLDGQDMSLALRGQPQKRIKPLMWQWRYRVFGHVLHKSPMLAIRDGNWKLLSNPNKNRVELYDIPNDPSEINNLAKQYPDIVENLMQKLLAWHKSLPSAPNDDDAGANHYPWPKE